MSVSGEVPNPKIIFKKCLQIATTTHSGVTSHTITLPNGQTIQVPISQISAVTSTNSDISTATTSLITSNTDAIIAAAAAGEAAGHGGLGTVAASDISEVESQQPAEGEVAEGEGGEGDGEGDGE